MSRAVALTPGENEPDLQAAARRAARREGLSLGEWLDAAVARKAAALGRTPDDLGPQERAAAVTDQLQRAPAEGPAAKPVRPLPPVWNAPEGRDRRPMANARPREVASWRSRGDDLRGGTAGALAATRPSRPSKVGAPVTRESQMMPDPRATEVDDLGQIETRLKSLFRTLDRRNADASSSEPRSEKDRSPPQDKAAQAPGRPRSLAAAIAEIQGRQAALDPAPASKAPASSPSKGAPTADAATALLDEFSSFGRRGAGRARASGEDPDVMSLRHDIAALSRSLGELAPKDTVKSLEAAVRDLSTKMEASRDGGLRDMILAPVERLARDLRASVKELDPRQAVNDLDREIRALGSKIETVTTSGIDAASLQRIQEQTTEVRDLLTAAATRPLPMDRVERQIADLDARIDRIGEGGTGSPMPSVSVTAALDEVRNVLAGLQGHGGFEALEQRVDGLASKIDTALASQIRPAAFEGLTRKIETLQTALEQRQAAPAAPVDLEPLERMIGGLIGRMDTIQGSQNELRGLETTVQRLAARVAEIGDPRAGSEVLGELQAQMGQLAARMERSDAGLAAIVSVERSLGELFAQLEETREAAVSAAEGAARTAARDTLRAAMLDQDRAPRAAGNDLAAEHVARELAEFRAAREEADQRVGLMLSTVNQTLEQIVGRLAAAETAAAERRSVEPQRPAAPFATPKPSPAAPARAAAERHPDVMDLGEADFPIEPGQGAGLRRAKAPDLQAESNHLIAAARRAAQAAAQEQAGRGSSNPGRESKQAPAIDVGTRAEAGGAKQAIASRRRPILLGLAGLILLLGAVQIARLTLSSPAGDQAASLPADRHDRTGELTPLSALPPKSLASVPEAAPTAPPSADPAAAAPSPATADATPAAAAPSKPVQQALPTLAMAPAVAKAAAHVQAEASQGVGAGLQALADSGQAAAQYELGVRLADGRGVARDPVTGATWLEKAARQGLAPAEYRLGSLYEKGSGVAKDAAKSVEWYQKAAEAGNVRAMHNLAVMSAEGAGGKSDYAKAAQWFSKASQMGVRDSQFNLAILYARGLGIEQSMMESYKWFAIAAAQGDQDAAKKRDEVAGRLDAKSLAAAKAAADDFKPITPLKAANEVQPPPGGWDNAAAPAHTG